MAGRAEAVVVGRLEDVRRGEEVGGQEQGQMEQ